MADIDTAAIRAAIEPGPGDFTYRHTIRLLCDALDAALANLELADSNAALVEMAYARQFKRAEAADAERDNLQHSLDRDLAGGRKRAYQIVLRGATNADYERSQRDYWAMRAAKEAAEARILDLESEVSEESIMRIGLANALTSAEARIADAMDHLDYCQCDNHVHVRRALAGGTDA